MDLPGDPYHNRKPMPALEMSVFTHILLEANVGNLKI
jgi:hypothetical protein